MLFLALVLMIMLSSLLRMFFVLSFFQIQLILSSSSGVLHDDKDKLCPLFTQQLLLMAIFAIAI